MKKNLSPLLAVLLAVPSAFAAPDVTGVSGAATHGGTLTITGTGFGTKTAAAPLFWDDLEGASPLPGWTFTGDFTSLNTTNNRHGNSRQNVHLNFAGASKGEAYFTAGNAVYDKWFVQYWFKVSTDWDWGTTDFSGTHKFLSNIKIFRMWNPGSTKENFVLAYRGWENRFAYNMEYASGSSAFTYVLPSASSVITRGTWHLLQFEYGENSALGVSDGVFRMWFDGQPAGAATNIMTKKLDDLAKRPFIVGWENEWNWTENGGGGPDPSPDAPNDYYMDDLYADNTWARVEIGDAATYDACTHREIQPPTAWSDTSVTITVNAGSFGTAATAYVYVTDANGLRNPAGAPLTITGGGISPDEEESDPGALKPVKKFLSPGGTVAFGDKTVEVEIRNADGRLVAHLDNGAGSVAWNGRDSDGRLVESGLYICRVKDASGSEEKTAIYVVK